MSESMLRYVIGLIQDATALLDAGDERRADGLLEEAISELEGLADQEEVARPANIALSYAGVPLERVPEGEQREAVAAYKRADREGRLSTDGTVVSSCPRNPEPHTLAECLAAEHERNQG